MQIPVYKGLGQFEYERLPFTYRGVTINNPSEGTGSEIQVSVTTVSKAWDAPLEPLSLRDGMESYDVRAMQTLIRLDGVCYATTFAALMDRVRLINKMFDPVVSYRVDGSTEDRGFLPFDFSVPTTDTVNYPSGLIPLRYYVRSTRVPIPSTSQFDGLSARFIVELQAIDPRCYLQTLDTKSLVNGANTVDNTLAEYPSWPILTAVTSATPTALTIAAGGHTLVLNVAGLALNDQIVVDFERREVKLNGVVTMSRYTSGGFFDLMPGNNTVTLTASGVSSAILSWRRAFV